MTAAFGSGYGQAGPAAACLARAGAWRLLEAAGLIYVLMISSGMFGFVDIITFGDLYEKQDASAFARTLWPIAYVVFGLLAARARRELLWSTQQSWWVLAFPLTVGASCLWSSDPEASFGGAIRVGMTTLIGLYLGTRFDLHELARAVFLVMLIAVGASLLVWLAGAEFAVVRDTSLRGLFHHKNTLGSRSALLFGTGLALLIAGWRPALALAGMAVALAAVVPSESATGLAVALLSITILPLAVVLRARWSTLVYALILLGALITAVAFTLIVYRIDPIREVLHALGRDLTFTGRIMLWEAALDYFQTRPLLGTGFDAFWSGSLDWRILIVMEDLGNILHFHNSFLEVVVQLGAVGVLAMVVTLSGYGQAALMAIRLRVDPLAPWGAIFGAILLAVAMVELEVFVQHKILHVLLVAIPIAARRQTLVARALHRWAHSPSFQPSPAAPAPVLEMLHGRA